MILILFVCGGGSGAYRAKRARLHCCAIDCFCLDADMVFQKEVRPGGVCSKFKGETKLWFLVAVSIAKRCGGSLALLFWGNMIATHTIPSLFFPNRQWRQQYEPP